jgi:hypothetical protein
MALIVSVLLPFAILLGSAVAASAPDEALVPGIIASPGAALPDVVSAPERVRVREDFGIRITTFGGGCEREGPTSVVLSETGAEVMVYDVTRATHPDIVCAAVIRRLPHTVTLRFEKPGQALIRVWGRSAASAASPFGEPIVLEHRIAVE